MVHVVKQDVNHEVDIIRVRRADKQNTEVASEQGNGVIRKLSVVESQRSKGTS